MLLRVGNELGHAVDAAAPELLVLVEQAAHDAEPLEIGADDLAASDALLRDQAGPFEDRDVLLDRREAHRVMAGQLDDALLGADRAANDVAPRVIGERAEHAVEVCEGGRRHDWHLYNLMVVPTVCQARAVAPAQKRPSGCAPFVPRSLTKLVSRRVSISPRPVRRLSETNEPGARLDHVRQCRFA